MKNLRGHFTLSVGGKLTESNNFNIFDPCGQGFVAIKLFLTTTLDSSIPSES